jgi:hypothetical protein
VSDWSGERVEMDRILRKFDADATLVNAGLHPEIRNAILDRAEERLWEVVLRWHAVLAWVRAQR